MPHKYLQKDSPSLWRRSRSAKMQELHIQYSLLYLVLYSQTKGNVCLFPGLWFECWSTEVAGTVACEQHSDSSVENRVFLQLWTADTVSQMLLCWGEFSVHSRRFSRMPTILPTCQQHSRFCRMILKMSPDLANRPLGTKAPYWGTMTCMHPVTPDPDFNLWLKLTFH